MIIVAGDLGLKLAERTFSLQQVRTPREVLLVGSTFFVIPVVEIDGEKVANGSPGNMTLGIQSEYIRVVWRRNS